MLGHYPSSASEQQTSSGRKNDVTATPPLNWVHWDHPRGWGKPETSWPRQQGFKTQVLFQVTLVPLLKGEMGIISVNTEIRDSKGKPLCGQPFHPNPAVKGLRVPGIQILVLIVHGNTPTEGTSRCLKKLSLTEDSNWISAQPLFPCQAIVNLNKCQIIARMCLTSVNIFAT